MIRLTAKRNRKIRNQKFEIGNPEGEAMQAPNKSSKTENCKQQKLQTKGAVFTHYTLPETYFFTSVATAPSHPVSLSAGSFSFFKKSVSKDSFFQLRIASSGTTSKGTVQALDVSL